MILAAAVGDGILIDNVIPSHMESFIAKLREMGVHVETNDDQIYVGRADKLKAVDIKTLVIQDFQQIFNSLLLLY